MKRSIPLLILGLMLAAPILMFSETNSDAPILITEKRPGAEAEAGQKTVIEKETWERKGARTVAEAIHLTPGVTVSATGTILDRAVVSIRGTGAEQVLVMMDGVPLNSGKGDPVNLNTLSLNNIARIEVIRGGNSAVYGEGAFGGAVNLITEREPPVYTEGEIYSRIGSFQTYAAGGSLHFPLPPLGTLTADITGEIRRTEGDYDYDSGKKTVSRDNSDGRADNFRGSLDWNILGQDRHRIFLKFSRYEGKRGIPGLMEFLTPEASLKESRANFSLRYRFTSYSEWGADAEYSFVEQNAEFENPESSLEDEHNNTSQRGRLDLTKKAEIGSWQFFPLMGGAFSRDNLSSTSLRSSNGTSLPGEAEQDRFSWYGRIEAAGPGFTLTPAGRWDFSRIRYEGWENNQDDQSTWSLTLSAPVPWYEKGTFKGNIGTAYHSPGFDDLFWSGGSFAAGNPDLLPEESLNWDGGLYLAPQKGLELSSVYFQSRTKNLIQWLPSAGGTWSPSNIGGTKSIGLENTLSWLIPLSTEKEAFLEIRGDYTWMRIRETTSDSINKGNLLAYRPVHSGSGSLSLLFNRQSLTFSTRYLGQRFTNMANTKDLSPVLIFDTTLKLVHPSGVYSSLTLSNLGDAEYIDRLGYPIPGREWSVKGGYEF